MTRVSQFNLLFVSLTLAVVGIVLALVAVRAQPTLQSNAPAYQPPSAGFTVSGTKILDPQGNEFVTKGVNINGYNWVWDREMTQDIDQIANCWNFNLVRANSLLMADPRGFPQYPDNDDLDKLIKSFADRKIVVMVSAHDKTGAYYTNDDQALVTLVNWYTNLAQRFKDNPYVWFNIMDGPGAAPPHDQQKWETVHREVITAIRGAGAQNIIVVDGVSWGQEAGSWDAVNVPEENSAILQWGQNLLTSTDGQPVKNTVFGLHVYDQWDTDAARLGDYVDRVQARGLPLIVNRFGADNQGRHQAGTVAMYQVMGARNIGRIVWHWRGGDAFDLTNGTPNGGGFEIDDCLNPTNLSWLGQQVWADTHPGTMPTPAPSVIATVPAGSPAPSASSETPSPSSGGYPGPETTPGMSESATPTITPFIVGDTPQPGTPTITPFIVGPTSEITPTRTPVVVGEPGTVTVSPTPFVVGPTTGTITATVAPGGDLAVTSLTLINADTDQPIAEFDPLTDGAILNLAALPTRNLNIRANTSGAVGSVQFQLNGETNFKTENDGPFTIAGDTEGDYAVWTPNQDIYTLIVVPFSGPDATGERGQALTVTFAVIEQ